MLLGAGTLLLPFATLFFDHVLSAALGFAAFVVLLLSRRAGARRLGGRPGRAAGGPRDRGRVPARARRRRARRLRRGRRRARRGASRLCGRASSSASCRCSSTTPGVRVADDAQLHERPRGARRRGRSRSSVRTRGLLRRRPARPASGALAPRLREGTAVVTPIAIVALRPAAALAGGTPGRGARLRSRPARLPGLQRRVLPSFGGQAPGPALPRSRAAVPRSPARGRPARTPSRRRRRSGCVSVAVMALVTITGPLTGEEYGDRRVARSGRARRARRDGRGGSGVDSAGWLSRSSPARARVRARAGASPLRDAASARSPLLAGASALVVVASVAPDLVPADEEHGTAAGAVAVFAARRRRDRPRPLRALGHARSSPWLRCSCSRHPTRTRPRLSLLVALAPLAVAAIVLGHVSRAAGRKAPDLDIPRARRRSRSPP